MKTGKTVFIVFGICLVLSVISGMAYLSPSKSRTSVNLRKMRLTRNQTG